MKKSFPKFAIETLEKWAKSDEHICWLYIITYYKKFILRAVLWDVSAVAVIGKRYETSRKQLYELRRQYKIKEIERITRKNNSAEIFYKIM